MNTKKRNIGARLGAMLLSLCLMMGLLPTTTFAAETDPFIFGYKSSGPIISVSTTNQSDYTEVADYDDSLLGLEIINGTIYGLSCDHSFYMSKLVILNPDFTIRNTVGSWFNENFVIVDTAVQNGTLWGTYNDEHADSYQFDYRTTGDCRDQKDHRPARE